MWKILLLSLISCAWASHFRGAVVQWRPIDPANFDGRVRTLIVPVLCNSINNYCSICQQNIRENTGNRRYNIIYITTYSLSLCTQKLWVDFSSYEFHEIV